MSNFIINEASDDENNEDDEGNFIQTESDNEFIDDSISDFNEDRSFYNFTNVEKSYDETMQECLENFDFNNVEARNYVDDDLSEDVDEFENFEKKIEKFVKTLFFPAKQSDDSFLFAVLYAIRYHLTDELCEVPDDFFKIGFENFKLRKSVLYY